MKTIISIARQDDWEKAQTSGQYTKSTIDSTLVDVGFIHCSIPDQTLDIANRKYSHEDNLILLLIEVDKVKPPVKFEGALSGRTGVFPHIYGPLNIDAVYATTILEKDKTGKFVPPVKLKEIINQVQV